MGNSEPSNASPPVPVYVLGTGLTALGTIRCFGRHGVPVYCLSARPSFERHSRWYRRAPVSVDDFGTAAGLEEALLPLAVERAFLLACSDHWTTELSRLSPAISGRFQTCLPETSVLEAFVDKARFAEALREAEVPHPRTDIIGSVDHLRELVENATSRVFLKPIDSQRFVAVFHRKAFEVSNPADAVAHYERAAGEGLVMILQEYVPGGADQHYFVDGFADSSGRIVDTLVRRRLRIYPPDFGNSCYMVTVDAEQGSAAVEGLQRLFDVTGYRGIFSAEFKRDQRDDQLRLLEVNCRPWWYVEFAAQCGLNTPLMAYSETTGGPAPKHERSPPGERLVYTPRDFYACRDRWRRGELGLGEWLASWTGSRRPVYALDDPAPAVVSFARWSVASVSRRIRRTPHRESP